MKKVTKKFLLNLADKIYNPKKKTFLRLCNGSLEGSCDPTNKKRTMHCGLGELYFEMTNRHPDTDSASEDSVVALAVERSPFPALQEKARKKAIAGIKALDVDGDLKQHLVGVVEDNLFESDDESTFRELLSEIPSDNDDDKDDESDAAYIARSKRVAEKLREAAACLPE